MNETNDGIILVEGNYLGKDEMKSEQRGQYEESEEHGQSMELPIRSNAGTGVDILEMSFYGKRYVHG